MGLCIRKIHIGVHYAVFDDFVDGLQAGLHCYTKKLGNFEIEGVSFWGDR